MAQKFKPILGRFFTSALQGGRFQLQGNFGSGAGRCLIERHSGNVGIFFDGIQPAPLVFRRPVKQTKKRVLNCLGDRPA